jgi:glutathione S-transferase
VLVDPEHDVEGMPESDDIVAYLEKTYGANASA